MSIPKRSAYCPIEIEQGATWRYEFSWYDASGAGIDLTSATDIRMQVRPRKDVKPGSATPDLDVSLAAGIDLVGDVQTATPITTAFAADGIIVASSALFESNGVLAQRTIDNVALPGDEVTIFGSTSNDGTYEVVSVDSEQQITVNATFTPEAAAGTVTVSRPFAFRVTFTAAETASLRITQGWYDIEIETTPGEVVPFMRGPVLVDAEITR